MVTLKEQLDALCYESEQKITNILQEFVDKTGYCPTNIRVNIAENTQLQDTRRKYKITNIDLSFGE